jgi:predicted branched-subunit amino acid permease
MDRESLKDGIRAGTPVAIAVALVAISFGVLAEPVVGAGATLALSALVFAGSAQFGSVAVLGAGGGLAAAVTAAVLLNARYLPMGIALAPSLRGGWLRRAAYGEAMIDASWAMASRGGGRFDPDFLVGATLPSYPAWVGGTAIGAFAGDVVGDPADLGLDVLFPAFFLALLLGGELRGDRTAVLVAALGAGTALVLTPLTPAGVPVIAAGAAALLGLGRRAGRVPHDRAGEHPEIEGDPVG